MDNYEKYKITELLEFCRQRNLSVFYRLKEDLIARLEADDLEQSHNEYGDNKSENNENTRDTNGHSERDNNDNSGDYNSRTNNEGEDNESTMAPSISFKDVEDALEKFRGNSNEDITEWLSNFEAVADTCAWSPVQT